MSSYLKLLAFLIILPLFSKIYLSFFLDVGFETYLFILISSFIHLVPIALLKGKFQKAYLYIISSTLGVTSCIDFFYAYGFKGIIAQEILFVAFNGNVAEVKEFAHDYFSLTFFTITILYWTSFVLAFRYLLKQTYKEAKLKLKLGLISVCLFTFGITFFMKGFSLNKTFNTYAKGSTPLVLVKSVLQYPFYLYTIHKSFEEDAPKTKGLKRLVKIDKPETHIFVIGESTTITKMSLYGYHRKTNPLLESIKDELDIFTNVQCTSPPITDVNVTRMLTLRDIENNSPEFFKTNIVKVMNELGFTTYWLSNHGAKDYAPTLITSIGHGSKVQDYTSEAGTYSFDGAVLKKLDEYLNDENKKRFILIHLTGGHGTYTSRYPKEFTKFVDENDIVEGKIPLSSWKKKLINEYDNAMLYHDWVLYNILDRLKKVEGLKSFVFTPDHGEEVFEYQDRFGHGGNIPSPALYKIPFLLWQGPEHKRLSSINVDTKRAYQTDQLIHSLMDLYKIDAAFFDESKSLFSSTYKEVNLLNFD